jgi:hypothetical protein
MCLEDGGAIDGDEMALASRAQLMQGAGDNLFASAAFAGDEDGYVAGATRSMRAKMSCIFPGGADE